MVRRSDLRVAARIILARWFRGHEISGTRQVVAMAASEEQVDFDKVLSDLADKVGVCWRQQFIVPAAVLGQVHSLLLFAV